MKNITYILLVSMALTACTTRYRADDPMDVKTACAGAQQNISLPSLSLNLLNEEKEGFLESKCFVRYSDTSDEKFFKKYLMINIIGDNKNALDKNPKWKEYYVTFISTKDGNEEIRQFKNAVFTALKPLINSKITLLKFFNSTVKSEFYEKVSNGDYKNGIPYVNGNLDLSITKQVSPLIDGTEYIYTMQVHLPKK